MKNRSVSESVIQSLKGNEVIIDKEEAAWRQLSNDSFLAEWDRLFEACPWATVFQSRAFVTTWYQAYQAKYQPIIIRAEYNGQLTGLLTLAVPASGDKGHIIGAGQFEAEYHAWLTAASDHGRFIKMALSKVLQLFPDFAIHLRFIPPPAPLQWTEESFWKKRCVLYATKRPLMDMSDRGLDKIFRKNEFRNKYSRLKKLGKVDFEHITSKDQFAVILEEVKDLYDFRRGAMFNKNLFMEDPRKVDFLLGLFEQNLLHVTVLKVNGRLFATNVATAMNNWVHLCGINVHIPFQARYYSPGFVNFILLSQLLASEGVSVFDLTPGGDFYKDRMATKYDQVHELMISNSRLYRLKRILRKKIYEQLDKAGKWPMGTELALRKLLYQLKGRIRQAKKQGFLRTALDKLSNLVNAPKKKVYVASVRGLSGNSTITVNRDSLKDMLSFEAEGTWMTRWEFLEDAMHRYEVGEHSYSYSENGRLLHCIWLKENNTFNVGDAQPKDNETNGDYFQLQGYYCHPTGQDRQIEFIEAVIAAVEGDQRDLTVQVITSTQDKRFCQTLRNMGFTETN